MREFDAVITALLLTTIRRLSNERLGERKKERGRDREGGRRTATVGNWAASIDFKWTA